MSQECPTVVGVALNGRVVPNPCTVVRNNPHPGRGTVLVLGTPRGGTSVVAGICHLLGVPMGADIDSSNVEDRTFQRVLASPQVVRDSTVYFAEAAKRAPLVGVKNPTIIDHLAKFYAVIPDPILVVVSRDVYATAQREESNGSDFMQGLRAAVRRKYAILDFVAAVSAPLVVVSYERLITQPEAAIETLSRFILGAVDADLVGRAAALVRPHVDMPNDVDFVFERTLLSVGALIDQRTVA